MKRYILIALVIISSCTENKMQEEKLFVLKQHTGINFNNQLSYDETFNPYLYRNFYNGGGVAIADINNDGLDDIYLTGNMVDNKLYLNKGDWQFEDITESAGVDCPNVWSSGATFVDINNDGFLDLYVCKAGKPEGQNRNNQLFINNGDLTFADASKEYGLDITGLSVQSAFFDYDKDGDLDCYLLNNSIKAIGAFDLIKDQRKIYDPENNGNKLLRNDNGYFVDVTKESGIYGSKIGFGLGVTLGDFNNDNWPDLYIANDFFEKDYLYINNKKGGFTEELENYFQSISMGAMGADYADLNNDLQSDIVVTEMLPKTEERKKTKTVFESWDKQQLAKKQGYYNQFSRNTLQRNIGNGKFLEIGRQSNISQTEWSWGSLILDMDNDGLKDIFITNGIYKDLLDRDYIAYEANDEQIRQKIKKGGKSIITDLIDAMPSKAISNVAFKNNGNFDFADSSKEWGLDLPSFSNGSAYSDLDNDGDLDLVVNNVNMPSFIYENTTDSLKNRSVSIQLIKDQSFAVGAKVYIKTSDGTVRFAENYTTRGFQSNVSPTIHLGVGDAKVIDSLWVKWQDGSITVKTDLQTNKKYKVNKEDATSFNASSPPTILSSSLLNKHDPLFQFTHVENKNVDFNKERLIPQMHSNEGPALAVADLNHDGIDDFFIGGAKNQSGRLFISSPTGFDEITSPFIEEINSEDTDAIFFDGDGDNDLDLYIAHGGRAYSQYSTSLNDTYYTNINNTFVKSKKALSFTKTIASSVVTASDYDKDGDIDLFVGERYKTNLYGQPCSGLILKNDGKGNFTELRPEQFNDIGMITDAAWVDINNDGWNDLVVSGEWMPLKVFINDKSKLVDSNKEYNLDATKGIWSSIAIVDIDKDGDSDIIAGNLGRNNFFSSEMKMYIADFDKNGFKEQIICKKENGKYYPIVEKDELVTQLPYLKKRFLYYKDYGKADIESIFTTEALKQAQQYTIQTLSSTIFFNHDGKFIAKKLPNEVQYSPVYSITYGDINDDGHLDLFLGGNQYLVKPQFGSYDASKGWAIFGPFNKDTPIDKPKNLGIEGQIRNLKWVTTKNKKILVAAINNNQTNFYTINEK
ncbi:FG-GAP-like repeat-containing protein [Spongiivirga sp. MCCC 1A20706]|uniref:VCBS repeat-containing protein n=1 Tax=Spongiivirga sp. MCCC 1A20706 TaxID=3160963 RepID=UPI003977BA17